MNEARWRELRAKLAPIRGAAQRAFGSEDGKKVLAALERGFISDSIPKDDNGKVDADAILINEGARRVIDYIRFLAEPVQEGQEP